MIYALVNDCTPSNGTIVAISNDAGELIDLHTDDTMRAIRLDSATVSVGDRIAIDWDASQVNLADCIDEHAALVNSDAYNTGYEAANQGEPRTANPYAKGTWDSNAWFAGWDAR